MLPICALLHVHQTLALRCVNNVVLGSLAILKITRKVQSNTFLFFVLYMCGNGGCNKTSQAILDLGLWELTLPPQWGYPGMSWDIQWDILDLGLWDFTLPPERRCPGMSWENPMGHVGPGTLGPYTVSIGWTSRDAPGYPMGHLGSGTLEPYSVSIGWISRDFPGCPMGHIGRDSGTLQCLHMQWGYSGMPRDIPWDILDLGLWDHTQSPWVGHPRMSQNIPWDILDMRL